VIVRPPAREALYHRFENELFDELIEKLCEHSDVKIILLARSESQRAAYTSRKCANMIVPSEALDGANLIAHADLVISAGGTMNREAAALGVPAATIYAGKWAAIDEELVREGRLLRIASREDMDGLQLRKKDTAVARRAMNVRTEVADLILK
jgi:predicted glycosyltransferase